MPLLKSSSGMAESAFTKILDRIAVKGRRSYRWIRRLGRTKIVEPDPTCPSNAEVLTSPLDKKWRVIEELGEFGRLLPEIRNSIYDYLPHKEILQLRLVNRGFNEDVSSLRGIHIKLFPRRHLYNFVRTIGVESLEIQDTVSVEQHRIRRNNGAMVLWLHPRQQIRLKYPGLLKELTIEEGIISPEDLRYIFHNCPRLQGFSINFSDVNLLQPGLFTPTGVFDIPSRLQTLKISGNCKNWDNKHLGKVQSLLSQANCPQLASFTLSWMFNFESRDHIADQFQYRLAASNFIKKHALSLKKIKINIFDGLNYQDYQHGIDGMPEMDLEYFDRDQEPQGNNNDGWINTLEVQLVNSISEAWKQTVNSRKILKKVHLRLEKLRWSAGEFRMEGEEWARGLRKIRISNIPMNSDSATLNLGVFRNCIQLEELQLQHKWINEPGLIAYFSRSRISNLTDLPTTLKTLDLEYFVLRADQVIEMVQNLPRLENLMLDHWTESESSLTDFLKTLICLFMTEGGTKVTSILLTGLRSEFEVANVEMDELRHLETKLSNCCRYFFHTIQFKIMDSFNQMFHIDRHVGPRVV